MRVLVWFCVLLLTHCSRTVVQSDHFYSDSDLTTTYNIGNVVGNKSLILILKSTLGVLVHPLTFAITSGKTVVTCTFNLITGLCVVPVVEDPKVSLKITCGVLPCEASWILYQPEVRAGNKMQTTGGLFQTPAAQNHMFAMVTCNDPKLQPDPKEVSVYSAVAYIRTSAPKSSTLYFLFTVQEKGYIYVDVGPTWAPCVQIIHYSVEAEIDVMKGVVLRDFMVKGSPALYSLKGNPTKDFGFGGVIHSLNGRQESKESTTLNITVKLTAERDRKVETVVSRRIYQENMSRPTIHFSFAFKALGAEYSNLQIEMETDQVQPNLFTFDFVQAQRQPVQLGDTLYFDLKKGQKLSYAVEAIEGVKSSKKITLTASKSVHLDKTQCDGVCEFEVTAEQDVFGTVVIGSNQFIEIEKKVTRKIREGDNMLFSYSLSKSKEVQVVVNSPNVIVYAAEERKCPMPSRDCREKTLNMHHPFIYEAEQDGLLLFNVEGLDSAQFTLTVIEAGTKYIDLKDNQPFSYLMDEEEQSLLFRFTILKNTQTTFNLITAPNTLDLFVRNGQKPPRDEDFTSDGYVVFRKKQIQSLTFIIQVRKAETSKNKMSQFTLIASTVNTVMRLEPSVTHYETLAPKSARSYIFQFSQKQKYLVNFYIHNQKGEQIKLALMASKDNKYRDDSSEKMIIDKQSDVMDVSEIAKTVCGKEQFCEVFLLLGNSMDREIDVVLTLVVQNAVIELKDGVWQSFGSNQISEFLRFYFHPQHIQSDIMLFYKPMNPKSYLSYNIWKADSRALNPVEWPFPQKNVTSNRASATIVIGKQAIKTLCWPYCVILITIFGEKGDSFMIMLANSQVQLPQKTRLQFSLKAQEERTVTVDLKYVLDKQVLHFFTTSTIGFSIIRASIASNRKLRCPLQDESDFLFTDIENNVAISAIKNIIEKEQMTDDGNVYMCIVIRAISSTKLSVEYTSDQEQAKSIEFNTFEAVSVRRGDKKLYKVAGAYDFTIKVLRMSGFPSILIDKCRGKEQIEDCTLRVKSNVDKGKQIVSKTQSFKQSSCGQCFFIIKVEAEEESNLTIHLQSAYSEMILKENTLLTDFTNEGQVNNYEITAVRNEQIIINLQVTEGQVQMRIINYYGLKIEKTSDTLIHVVVRAEENREKQSVLGSVQSMSTTSPFVYTSVQVKSKEPTKASSYILSYSSGKRELYLQDGVVADYQLDANKKNVFYYANERQSDHVYLLVAMNDSTALKALYMRVYYLEEADDLESKVQVVLSKPTLKKHTLTPSYLFLLPKQSNYMFELASPTNQSVTLNINHQEVILLPFDHDFPFTLHSNEDLNVLVDVNIVGYVILMLKKCDRSTTTFSYTFDYDAFVKGQYSYTTSLDTQPYYSYVLKANKIGTLYLNFKAGEQNVLLSLKSTFSITKQKNVTPKPGKKGLLTYEISSNNQAVISFSKVVCPNSVCTEQYKYYTLTSTNEQNLYSQLVCPSSYFAVTEGSFDPLPATEIHYSRTKDDVISFPYDLLDHISYVGVKAVAKDGTEIFYNPTEISTLWGQISRSSTKHLSTITIIVVVVLFCLILTVRRHARGGYRRLEDNQ